MDFQVLIDDSILALGLGSEIAPSDKNWLLSLANDFEDGAWRTSVFNEFVWDNIAETALSVNERTALHHQPQSLLIAAAKKLRITNKQGDIGDGSELAEIFLYGVMKHKYHALPVVPKIFYKQNTQDYAKGADSVHIVVDDNDKFTLWFGEAKFYKDIQDSDLGSIVDSVRNSLSTQKLKKENSIITNLADLGELLLSSTLKHEIKNALANKNSIDLIKPIINIPILILHECAITAGSTSNSSVYLSDLKNFHQERAIAYFKKQQTRLKNIHMHEDITFHLILVPVPEKRPIIEHFLAMANIYRN